ncbi:transcriptional regulator, DeoR family [Paenibacillaceae bacterium GAS479]|nr:transcriptional regulator, DeoR family [Paenibacillaceae bacterium GAS479]
MKTRRLQDIELYIQNRKEVTLDELCQRFDVSKNTIRRDLSMLMQRGTIGKVYGGAVSHSQAAAPGNFDLPGYGTDKTRIARAAAELVEPHDIIFVDSGTTTRSLAESLDPQMPLTILTNSLDVIIGAAALPQTELVIIGSQFRRLTRAFVGVHPEDLHRYNINKAFMATTGVSITHGLTTLDLMEHQIKKQAASKAERLYLLADASKFGRSTLLTYAALDEVDGIITSELPVSEYILFSKQHGIQLIVADEDEKRSAAEVT